MGTFNKSQHVKVKGSVWRDAYREQIAQVSKEALSKQTAEEAELEAKLMKRKHKQSKSNKSRHVKVKVTAKLMKRKSKQSESDKGHHVKVKAAGWLDSYREDRTDTTRVPGSLSSTQFGTTWSRSKSARKGQKNQMVTI